MLAVEIIPLLKDNYAYFICDITTNTTAIIDPSSSEPILDYLGKQNLDYILNTHHHWDHTDGNLSIKKEKGAQVVGFQGDSKRIPGIDICVENHFQFGDYDVDVLHVPGHTLGHVAFFFREDKILFCGDTLFVAGCGRVFEGTMEQMHNSLQLLKKLSDETQIYCGHEYTAYNIRFALSLEPNNPDVQAVYKKVRKLRKDLKPTVPSTISQEKLTNPFFRTDEIKPSLNMKNSTSLEVFTKLRSLKDSF